MKGRAEYETLEGKYLFEGGSPSSLFPWVLEEGYERGMIIGERGVGKTFFIRKLAEEIPTKIYQLNKEALEYETYLEPNNPKLIVADDVHYLLQMMRFGHLLNRPVIEKRDVLKKLESLDKEAEKSDTKIVFVADDSPAGLYYNFTGEKNKREFLRLFNGCVASYDDSVVFLDYLGESQKRKRNIFKFRESFTNELTLRMRKEFGMRDMPLMVPNINYNYLSKGVHNHLLNKQIIVSEEKPEMIRNEYRVVEWSPSDSGEEGQRKIATIRELKVLSEELGEVSRKTLGIGFGREVEVWETKEWQYYLTDMPLIENIIHRRYSNIVREKLWKNLRYLAGALLSAKSDNEFRAILLEHELSKE